MRTMTNATRKKHEHRRMADVSIISHLPHRFSLLPHHDTIICGTCYPPTSLMKLRGQNSTASWNYIIRFNPWSSSSYFHSTGYNRHPAAIEFTSHDSLSDFFIPGCHLTPCWLYSCRFISCKSATTRKPKLAFSRMAICPVPRQVRPDFITLLLTVGKNRYFAFARSFLSLSLLI